jgi:ribonuclease HI
MESSPTLQKSGSARSGEPFFPAGATVTMLTAVRRDRWTGCGGWGVIIRAPALRQRLTGSGILKRTAKRRAELTAVIQGLRRLRGPCTVQLVSSSRYVINGIVKELDRWRERRWRAGRKRKRELEHADLWQRLDRLLQPHTATSEWVPGNSSIPLKKECDELARTAMQRAIDRWV